MIKRTNTFAVAAYIFLSSYSMLSFAVEQKNIESSVHEMHLVSAVHKSDSNVGIGTYQLARAEVKERRSEVRENRAEVKERRSEVKENRSEVKERRSEVKENRAEVKERRSEVKENRAAVKENRAERT
jgi:peptidoglycan hydrolase CwlO-like protein